MQRFTLFVEWLGDFYSDHEFPCACVIACAWSLFLVVVVKPFLG